MPLSQAYTPPADFYDEMFTPNAGVRPHCLGLGRLLLRTTPDQLASLRVEAGIALIFFIVPKIRVLGSSRL